MAGDAKAKAEEVKAILKGWYDTEGFGGASFGAAQVAAAVFGPEWVSAVEHEWKLEHGEAEEPNDGINPE